MRSTNNKTKSRRKYDAAFKEQALQMIEDGRPVSDVAQALGMGENLLYRWRRRARAKVSHQLDQFPEASALVEENKRLKAALQRTEQERDILKKALGIFSQQP
jgi:transposase